MRDLAQLSNQLAALRRINRADDDALNRISDHFWPIIHPSGNSSPRDADSHGWPKAYRLALVPYYFDTAQRDSSPTFVICCDNQGEREPLLMGFDPFSQNALNVLTAFTEGFFQRGVAELVAPANQQPGFFELVAADIGPAEPGTRPEVAVLAYMLQVDRAAMQLFRRHVQSSRHPGLMTDDASFFTGHASDNRVLRRVSLHLIATYEPE